MADENAEKMEAVDLSQMSDEDVMKMDDGDLMVAVTDEGKPDSEGGSSDDNTDEDTKDQGNPDDGTGGADDNEDPSDSESNSGDPFAKGQGSSDGSASDDDDADKTPKDNQSEDKGESDDSKDEQDDKESTFEAKYKELMAPFRAAKREVQLDNIEDARRLMQMGVDYSKKMETMKPHLRVIRTLEAAELLDPSRINFLIDLSKNDPAAIKKLLKDNDIDPMALNLEGSEDYKPTDHAPGDAELAVREVFENIKGDPKFDVTLDVITNKLDKVSRESLQERPEVIAEIHNHIEAGIYDTVMDRVANERMFGKLTGLSDLQAYYTVGDQMFQNGELGNQGTSTEDSASADDKPKGTAQGSGSDAADKAKADKADLRNRKRAAKPPRGKPAKGGKKRPDFSKMSDKEIEELDISSF